MKPFRCDRCTESFKTEMGLSAHRKQMHGIKDESGVDLCHICQVPFRSKMLRKFHMKSEHGLEEKINNDCENEQNKKLKLLELYK